MPALVAVQVVLIGWWSRRRTSGARRAMLIGFVVGPLLVVLQSLVVTDRERLVSVCHGLARAVQDGDVEALGSHLSSRFAAPGPGEATSLDKEALIQRVERFLEAYDIEEARLGQFEIEVTGDRAVVRFTATCRVITPQQVVPHYPSPWELDFERADGGWQVIDLRPRSTGVFPYHRLADLLR